MKRAKPVFCLALICAAFLSLPAFAQPQISGPQSGTLGPGTYLVVGDIRVNAGATLTVVPGTTFLHNGHWYWWISGQLNAEGTASDSIKFIRQQEIPEHRWGGIRFMSGASAASTLEYCVIDNAVVSAGTPSPYKGGGIFSDGVGLSIAHTRLSNCDDYWGGGGMYIQYASGLVVDHCLIVDNEATLGSNGGGIYLFGCPQADISYNVIARNSATGT
ncbi:MAG TPA: right-handed parallel beta-helix repeat-containing protein [bacterium]|jgi:hypothetical protein